MLLGRENKRTKKLEPVGAFQPEIYVMAKAGKLAWQIENNQQFLRHNNGKGRLKTPLELAIIPTVSYSGIASYFRKAITLKDKSRVPLPSQVFKLRIKDEFLPHIKEMGLDFYKTKNLPDVDDIKINLRNRQHLTKITERLMHYTGQWLAFALALVAGVELAMLSGLLGLSVVAPFVAGYLASKCSKEFAFFDLAEFLFRDSGWMFDKDYYWNGKFSFKKALETSTYLSAIGYGIYMAVPGVWNAALSWSAWGALATAGAPAALITAASLTIAATMALTTVAMTWVFANYATRYFWPLSFFDNAISAKEGKAIASKLSVVNVSDEKMAKEVTENKQLDKVLEKSSSLTPNRSRRQNAHNDEDVVASVRKSPRARVH